MKLIEQAAEGLRNLYYSKLRSLLALLGVLVGTASVVAMVLGGDLATSEALKQFKALGTDLLAISLNTSDPTNDGSIGRTENLTLSQAMGMAKADSSILQVAPYTQLFHPISYNGYPLNAMMLGVTDSFSKVINIRLVSGRFISLVDQYNFFCVIGHDVYQAIKKISYKEPLGQHIQIGKNIFVIVGVAQVWPENNFVYANINNSIMVPIMASTVISKYATINNVILRLSPQIDINDLEKNISTYLSNAFTNSKKQISYRSAKELIARMENQSNILTIFLGLIGSISLVVGGIGVMNIMLVSVIERRREIGIRLAVGAKRRDIVILFLIEAVMLSLLGGMIGVLLGISVAYVIALFWHWEFILFIWPPIIGFSVSVIVGIFFGFYPAYRASRLDPIEALR